MEQFILDFFSGIGNINFGSIMNILLVSLGIFWLVVLYWVWLDASERTSNNWSKSAYVLLVLFLNVFGLIIYLLIRPSQTIEEIYWADLERRYLRYETAELGDCPRCGEQLSIGYRYCPVCRYKLKIKCANCGIYIDRKSKYCANCGEETRRNSKFVPETVPSKEVMEEQIAASKEKAQEVVESNQVRYSSRKSIPVQLGDTLLSLLSKVKNLFKREEKGKGQVNEKVEKHLNKKGKKKKKKNK